MRNKEGLNIFKKLALVICLLFGFKLYAQTPSVYPAVSLTAASTSTSAIPLTGFATCNVSITITGTGTGTVQVQGSTDGGTTYSIMNMSALLTPSTVATTETITAAGVYQVNCGGFTHLKFVTTSASFTLTSVIFTLTGAPNTQISRSSGGSGSGTVNSGTANQLAYYATTGTAISGNPRFTENAGNVGLVNGLDASSYWNFQAGATADQNEGMEFSDHLGNGKWLTIMTGGSWEVYDLANFLPRAQFLPNGASYLGAGAGANAVVFGGLSGQGTGGLSFCEGGTNFAVCPASISGVGGATFATYSTSSNCSSAASPAVCGSAAAGSVLIPTGTTSETLTVNTTAVTANSQIFFYPDDSLGTKLGVTCNSTLATLAGGSFISARTAGTSFQITFNGSILTNGVCGSFHILN